MADNNNKLGIVAEIKVDQSDAKAGFEGLRKELAGFKAGFDHLHQGIVAVLKSLAFIAQEIRHGTTETKKSTEAMDDQAESAKKAGAAVEDLSDATGEAKEKTESLAGAFLGGVREGIEKAVEESKNLDDNTQKASASAGIFRGIWERIGHTIVDGAVAALRGLVNYLAQGLEQANDFDVVMDRMAARGVEGINKMRVAVVELAGELGENLVDIADSVDLAESLGAGDEAVDAARAAWENYRVTGMDVNEQIKVSARLVRGFNLDMADQADVIMQVANAAQQARVDQSMMWDGLSALGPRVKQLGGSFKDLMDITQAGISGGIKVGEDGLEGFSETLNSLLKPTKEFAASLVETGAVVTKSSPVWKEMNAQVAAQKTEFEALNNEIKEYKSELSAISLVTSQAERAAEKFEELQAKRASGERLNKAEREAYRNLRRELAGYNDELAKYDDAGYIVQDYQFKHMSVLDQLRQRIDAAKEAQKDLSLASQDAQLDAQKMGASYNALNTELSGVAARMAGEIPGAIQAAIQDGSLAQLIQKLAAAPEALKPLSGEVKTLISTVSANLGNVATEAEKAGGAVAGIGEQAKQMADGGTNAFGRLKEGLSTIRSQVVSPLMDVFNVLAQRIDDWLGETFGDGNSNIYTVIAQWAINMGAMLTEDINNLFDGNDTLDNVLTKWFKLALENVRFLWSEYAKPIVDALIENLGVEMPNLHNVMVKAFEALGSAAKEALLNSLSGALNSIGDTLFGNMFGNKGNGLFGSTTAEYGDAYYRTRAGQMLSQAGDGAGSTNNFNIYGATNADDVASKVSQSLARQERLGYSGSRLR